VRLAARGHRSHGGAARCWTNDRICSVGGHAAPTSRLSRSSGGGRSRPVYRRRRHARAWLVVIGRSGGRRDRGRDRGGEAGLACGRCTPRGAYAGGGDQAGDRAEGRRAGETSRQHMRTHPPTHTRTPTRAHAHTDARTLTRTHASSLRGRRPRPSWPVSRRRSRKLWRWRARPRRRRKRPSCARLRRWARWPTSRPS